MLQIARKDQRFRAQRLCDMASDRSIAYRLPEGDLHRTLWENSRPRRVVYWVLAQNLVGESYKSQEFWYGLYAQDGSYGGVFPEDFLSSDDYDKLQRTLL